MKKQDFKLENLMAMTKNMMDHIQISNSSPDKMDLPNYQDPTIAIRDKNNYPPLEDVHSKKLWRVDSQT